MNKSCSIGIFDSGLGGLTVLREIMRSLPQEHITYFGDTARVPYGNKSQETILRYSSENTSFLVSHQIKMLVIACNTSSAYAIENLRQQFSIPIIDVIDPTVQMAAQKTKTQRIAVLGTKGTVKSGVYERKIQELLPAAEVISIACPLFVPLVEENFLSHPATALIIREYLQPVIDANVDVLILGCTHYPLLIAEIQKAVGDKVHILDSASTTAKRVSEELNKYQIKSDLNQEGRRNYFVSDDPEKFQRLGESFLGIPIRRVVLLESDISLA